MACLICALTAQPHRLHSRWHASRKQSLLSQLLTLFHAHAGGMGMWVREHATLTGRRWRSIILGRRSVKTFLHSEVPLQPSPEP